MKAVGSATRQMRGSSQISSGRNMTGTMIPAMSRTRQMAQTPPPRVSPTPGVIRTGAGANGAIGAHGPSMKASR
eukprot:7423618-Alexandrium_andersonii.AAC.1